jgi:predicted O-methyltransferase YrrM
MRKMRRAVLHVPGGRVALRFRFAWNYFHQPLKQMIHWAFSQKEENNFYYRVSEINRDQIIQACSFLLGNTYEEIEQFIYELEEDDEIKQHIHERLIKNGFSKDIEVNFGRRIAWYAFVRALKPRVVIETGVAHGVGACVIAKALEENAKDGAPGRYFGTDIDRGAGSVFSGRYSQQGKILYGDSIESLKSLESKIDLFINDSDHDSEYEYREYWQVKSKLSERAIIIGDNSHATMSLSRFARETGRTFIFIPEFPKDHWYPGAGIGVSIPKTS